MNQNVGDYVHESFTIEKYKKAYSFNISPYKRPCFLG